MSGPARVLLVDPPWRFGDALGKRGADAQYRTMTAAELMDMGLPPLAPDCLLLLWRVAAMQAEALAVVSAWGFVLKSEIVWIKLARAKTRRAPCATCSRDPSPKHFGMGRYVRASHETCLVAVRGKVSVVDHSVRSVFEAPVREHSRKPDEIHRIAERLVPGGPYVELFGREHRPGWTVLGDEVGKFTVEEAP